MHQGRERQARDFFGNLIADLGGLPGLVGVGFYRSFTAPTDLSLHLSWSGTAIEAHGSPLGLIIAESLKDLGLLDHSAWIKERTDADMREHESDARLNRP
jgi:hypothetical protein